MSPERDQPASVRVVLVTTGGTELPAEEPPDEVDVGELVRDAGHRIGAAVEHAREFRASPGRRLGAGAGSGLGSTRRRGGPEEVQTPVAVRPELALRLASTDAVLYQGIGAISVDTSTVSAEAHASGIGRVSCSVRVRTGSVMRRRASLRIRPSPSNNLTIIELVPTRAPWFRTGAFLRAAVPAVRELGDRLRAGGTVAA